VVGQHQRAGGDEQPGMVSISGSLAGMKLPKARTKMAMVTGPPGTAGGLRSVEIAAHEERLHLGSGQPVEDWSRGLVHQRLVMGPPRSLYLDSQPDRQREVRAALAEELDAYWVDADDPMSGLAMDAAGWVIDARP
jgi:hypothetical protein